MMMMATYDDFDNDFFKFYRNASVLNSSGGSKYGTVLIAKPECTDEVALGATCGADSSLLARTAGSRR
jgi:hypothetical protein